MSAFFIYCLSTLMAQFGSQQCSKLLELVEYGFHNSTLFFMCSLLLLSFLDDLHELFFKIYFIFNCGVSSLSAHVVSLCVCACLCVCAHVSGCSTHRNQKRASNTPELELQLGVRYLMPGFGTKLGSYVRAGSTLNY